MRAVSAVVLTSCQLLTANGSSTRHAGEPRRHAARCCRPQRRRATGRPAAAAADGGAPIAEEEELGCVLGIDLGTTNSCAALMEGGDPVVVPNQEGAPTTPSVVAFAADGSVLVGAPARRQAAINPANTFFSVKRLIGKSYVEVEQDAGQLSYAVAADDDGFVVLECPQLAAAAADGASAGDGGEEEEGAGPGRLYPEEISAYVLANLIDAAQKFTGRPVTKAVVSVPAYFNDEQREATITAGRIAGLEKIRIIREPVAAALAYGLDALQDQTVLVFDLGGGTFDVSLLEVGGGVIEVLSTGGDASLGGDDWDKVIMQWLIKEHLRPARVDCRDPRLLANLRGVAEAAKIKLSSEDKVVIRMPVGGGIEAVLTQKMFESMTKDLFRRARLPLDQACWQAGVDLGTAVKEYDDAVRSVKKGGSKRGATKQGQAAAELAASGVQIRPKRRLPVGEVLLVGGATRMPAIRRFVRNMTGLEAAEFVVDPDQAVALGAAVQAGIYEGQVSDLMVMDVWQASLMRAFAKLQAQREEEEELGLAAGGDAAEQRERRGGGDTSASDDEGGHCCRHRRHRRLPPPLRRPPATMEGACPRCGAEDAVELDLVQGVSACTVCGAVLAEEPLVNAAEFDEGGARMGTAVHAADTGEVAAAFALDSSGAALTIKRSKTGSSQAKTKARVREMAALLQVQPAVQNQAVHLLEQALPLLTVAWRRDNLAAAAAYAACRLNSLPLTLADVSSATQIDVHTLGRHYLGLVRLLELQPPLLLPADLLPRAVDRVTQQAAASGALSSAHVAALRRDAATLLGWMSRQLERRQLPLASVGAALVLAGEMSAVALSLGHVCTSLQLSRTTLDRKLAQVRARLVELSGLLPYAASVDARNVGTHARTIMQLTMLLGCAAPDGSDTTSQAEGKAQQQQQQQQQQQEQRQEEEGEEEEQQRQRQEEEQQRQRQEEEEQQRQRQEERQQQQQQQEQR
ncbi:molecular chaperone [Micractinium conductrix]|uniref:Molecular chaperone n=1 Tax=Micractinium conductrix TaxID=554055 RepID=A0A2P6VC37_9CHLO|nr:molecular chaperone [Micractinium conductrix]|eukprot:PSC71655.1 molecular chaperone [Micractinium conductrix]